MTKNYVHYPFPKSFNEPVPISPVYEYSKI